MSSHDGVLVVSWSFAAPIEAVWSALTDPALLSRWLGEAVECDVRVGGSLVVDMARGTSLEAT
jgi:uncharacterized protein YndB with AHSA1/START domain